MLQHVIERCQQIESATSVIVACPDTPLENKTLELVSQCGALGHQGSELDVLGRFRGAADLAESDYIMRVTADCPLLDPTVCNDLFKLLLAEGADYGATANWPHGLDCEVFSRALLEEAHRHASAEPDREHVTLWMKRRNDIKSVSLTPSTGHLHANNRWVVDYPEDYEFLKSLFALLPADTSLLPWQAVLEIVEQNPHLRRINEKSASEWGKKNQQIYRSVGHHWESPT